VIPAASAASAGDVATSDPSSAESRSKISDDNSTTASNTDGAPSDNPFTRPGTESSGGERAGQTAASGDAVPRSVGDGHQPSADATATAAGGGGATDATAPAIAPNATSGTRASSGANAAAAASEKSPPWSSSSWDADRAAVGEAVRSGRVPDAYRDVVREYFRERDSNNGSAR